MATLKAQNIAIDRFVLGTPNDVVTVAASGSVVCGPIDLQRVDTSTGVIVLDVGGAGGSVKLTGQISHNGEDEAYTYPADLIATTTSGGVYKLSDSSFVYGRYLTVTATETVGSNAADVKVYFMAQGA